MPGDNNDFTKEARALQGESPISEAIKHGELLGVDKYKNAKWNTLIQGDNVKRIGIYHSKDLDGICCGAIMKLKYPDITLIGYDYGENIWEKLRNAGFVDESMSPIKSLQSKFDGYIIMADVSLEMPEMFKLAEWCEFRFTWIDHHKSAIEAFWGLADNDNTPDKIPDTRYYTADVDKFGRVFFKVGRAACEICWDCMMANSFEKSKYYEDIPEVVKYLGMYDTWRNEDKDMWNVTIMPFQYGMRLICRGVEDFPMYLLKRSEVFDPLRGPCPVKTECDNIIRDGRTVLKYQKQMNTRAAVMIAFEVEFEGLRAICMNSGGANSQLFDSVYDPEKHDIMIPFVFTGKHWIFSIYTTKPEIDCSEIAKRYGGGGHKQAAGFVVTDAHWFAETFLIFQKRQRDVPFKDEAL